MNKEQLMLPAPDYTRWVFYWKAPQQQKQTPQVPKTLQTIDRSMRILIDRLEVMEEMEAFWREIFGDHN